MGVMYTYNGGTAKTYYYRKNAQGDVTAIYNAAGTRLAEYAYDAFGNCTIIYGSSATIAGVNPIRYRSYYFDRETGLYYLNARYYNPQWRRFISPDDTAYLDPESVNGLNLYCYCYNDPVNYADPSGNLPIDYILDAIFIAWGVIDLFNGGYKDWKNWVALGVDVLFAVFPYIPSGFGQVLKIGNRIDDAKDVAKLINKIDDIQDVSKLTIIGRSMPRVNMTASYIGKADNLYKPWNKYDSTAKGLKRFVHDGISMTHDGLWMFGKLRSGYTVIDIGMKTDQTKRGLWYGIEKLTIGLWEMRNIWKIPINCYF